LASRCESCGGSMVDGVVTLSATILLFASGGKYSPSAMAGAL
jgi:hypothetical protein